ncbi:MAG: HepT-like ribonuclease domain-containing protein [Gammaproteobacteria bacterium]
MSDFIQREWRIYLDDMIDFAGKVLSYTDGFDQAVFLDSVLTYDATLRNLELIGEAATHIPDEVRAAHPEIPWRMIIATRNRLIHGYLGIDDDTLWSIIRDDVPELLPLLQALKNEAKP